VAEHSERRLLPYTAEQMYDLVAAVDRYPEFLPWCIGARIVRRDGNVFWADLIIGWKLIRERFKSKVTLEPKHRIYVEYVEGPMRYLHNDWTFEPHEAGCAVSFHLDFEFRSKTLNAVMGALFHEAVRRMVGAFEERAKQLYGGRPRS
jgi:coenzyme Q-binding protein COQ10